MGASGLPPMKADSAPATRNGKASRAPHIFVVHQPGQGEPAGQGAEYQVSLHMVPYPLCVNIAIT